ncbi:hypothetical protein PHOSAC3_120830 [Mesotoga infera]|nr:hypothetical protein PHOSAC3_120830 [Mesotoga infera]
MKKGISYMFVSRKESEKENKMVCASKTVSVIIVAICYPLFRSKYRTSS